MNFPCNVIIVCWTKGYLATCGEMDDNSSNAGSDNIDWNTDDELDIADISSPSSFSMSTSANAAGVTTEVGELTSSSSHPSKIVNDFLKMGFPEAMVTKVISELGENNTEAILDTLLTYSVVDDIPEQETRSNDRNIIPQSNFESEFFSDLDSDFSDEDSAESFEKDDPVVSLIDMGYSPNEASAAVSRCGIDAPLSELVDFISAAHLSKEADAEMDKLYFSSHPLQKDKKRKLPKEKSHSIKRYPKIERKRRDDDDDALHLPNPMIGFGVPRESFQVVSRTLRREAIGPPYFLYENVALTPKGVWNTIKSHLYEIEPEFVDSKFFCAAARKRGYIHNLPLNDRFPIQPLPPRSIFQALPATKKWWPSWDDREQLNCILTCVGSAQLTDRIRTALEKYDGVPDKHVKKYVMGQVKKWNLVWTGKNKVAPLEPDEIELIMGYPLYHTRGYSRSERYKGLGNAFQVDTVAYQLSVLKSLYPEGMNVLSLFSGIGGAEVALHKLGIPMKNVVSVEKSNVCRRIIEGWWEQTNQEGKLIHVSDVREVTDGKLEGWIRSFGGFDLVIGGSPCNNLAGGNRRTRDGLEGEHSSLFFDYVRILDTVKIIMGTT
ncbi:putative DNA (cytosine-5-)-methyltransferase [Helianthus annuus]|nr:putative DNA (cytosine-5-)-methyltransferase [Helianthus annuus]